jgi:hypothetical protein
MISAYADAGLNPNGNVKSKNPYINISWIKSETAEATSIEFERDNVSAVNCAGKLCISITSCKSKFTTSD